MAVSSLRNRLRQSIGAGLEYIRCLQNREGYWEDFWIPGQGGSTQWVTGYVGAACLFCAQPILDMQKTVDWLLQTEITGGAWGYNQNNLADADSTANVLRFLAQCPELIVSRKELYTKADLLIKFQDPLSGGFATYLPEEGGLWRGSNWCQPEVTVSAMAGLALLALGADRYQTVLHKIKAYLLHEQDASGCWRSYWWNTEAYGINLACRFLLELGVREAVGWASEYLFDDVEQAGSDRSNPWLVQPFATALIMDTFISSPYRNRYEHKISEGLDYMLAAQRTDGSWESFPNLEVPDPLAKAPPWMNPGRFIPRVVSDQNRLFTSATVIGILSLILNT